MSFSVESINNKTENSESLNNASTLSEIPPFDKEAAKRNIEAAKQQIEQEKNQEKVLDARVESLAIPLARDYAEKNYPKMSDGTFLPAWRGVNGEKHLKNESPYSLMADHWPEEEAFAAVIDIANTPYNEYSEYWKEQNRGGAEFLIKLLDERGADVLSGLDLSDEKVREEYGALIHDNWLERNQWVKDPEYGNPILAKPYTELPASEQQKDIDQLAVMQEWLKKQDRPKSDKELYDRMKEIYHKTLEKRHPKTNTPEELAELEEIHAQLMANINNPEEAGRLIEADPRWAADHVKELADKGADPLKILEIVAHAGPLNKLGNELLGMGYSLRDMVDKIDEVSLEEWFSYFVEKGIDPDILKTKLGENTYKMKKRQYEQHH